MPSFFPRVDCRIRKITEPLYTGPLATTFRYEIANSLGYSAETIMTGAGPENSMLGSIVDSTSTLVGRVVDDVFRNGGGPVESAKDDFYDPSVGAGPGGGPPPGGAFGGIGPGAFGGMGAGASGQASPTSSPFVELELPSPDELGLTTTMATTAESHSVGGGLVHTTEATVYVSREELLAGLGGGGAGTVFEREVHQRLIGAPHDQDGEGDMRRAKRSLLVVEKPDSVNVTAMEDIPCPTKVNAMSGTNRCQLVTATAVLLLTDEPKGRTTLAFHQGIEKALSTPDLDLPPNIVYAGPSTRAFVPQPSDPVPSPVMTAPNPAPEEGGGDGWIVPVSIAAAGAGLAVLVLLAGRHVVNRRKTLRSLDGDLASPGDSHDMIGNVLPGTPEDERNRVSPLDADYDFMEAGHKRYSPNRSPNPFLNGSREGSLGSFSMSSSESGSTSSDIEDDGASPPSGAAGGQTELERRIAADRGARSLSPEQARAIQDQQGYRLQTLHEVSEENLSASGWSLMSGQSDKSDRSVYRAGVEALVKEGEFPFCYVCVFVWNFFLWRI